MCMTEKMVSTEAIIILICVITLTISDQDVCHDVAVIGGGVVGGYAVWQLRKQGLGVGLYEFSNRLGGRLYTHRFSQAPDIPIEIGAMRFSMDQHPIFYHTVQEVGLKTQTFEGLDYDASDRAICFLRGKHLRKKDFNENRVPYNLRAHESRGIQDIYRFLTLKTNFSGDSSLLHEELPFLVSEDGVRLTNQTFQEFLKKYLSAEAIEMISNVDKFSTYNRTAADTLRDKLINDTLVSLNMSTISGGMQQLPERLVKQFLSASRKHSLHLGHQLVNITKTKYMLTLGFIKTPTVDGKTSQTSEAISVCSRRVILAVPSTALRQISCAILQRRDIVSNLSTVNNHFGVKFVLAYTYPWWRESKYKTKTHCWTTKSNDCRKSCPESDCQSYMYRRGDIGPKINSDLPLDMTFDLGISNKTGTAVLLAAYSLNGIWSDLQKHGEFIGQGYHSVSTEVIRHAHMYLARLYNIPFADIPPPTDAFISRWDAYPYGAPFCTSKAGVDSKTVWKTIHKPSDVDDLFIASGPYSTRMSDAWSEYTLEAMKEIIDNYF